MKIIKVNAGNNNVDVMLINGEDIEIKLNQDQSVRVIREDQNSILKTNTIQRPHNYENGKVWFDVYQ